MTFQVGLLSKGQWSGLAWLWKEGGTFLHGPVDYFGHWSGNQIAYIYPDLKHCLLGSYTKGRLEVAQFCYVASIRFIKGHIPHLTYSECQGTMYYRVSQQVWDRKISKAQYDLFVKSHMQNINFLGKTVGI